MPKRSRTVAALRAAISAVDSQIGALKQERAGLYSHLARSLCPVEAGDRFTAEDVPAYGGPVVTREDVFVADEILPRGHGLSDPNRAGWIVISRRELRGGGLSVRTYAFTKENRVRKLGAGEGSK
jgi:hypothetical protein